MEQPHAFADLWLPESWLRSQLQKLDQANLHYAKADGSSKNVNLSYSIRSERIFLALYSFSKHINFKIKYQDSARFGPYNSQNKLPKINGNRAVSYFSIIMWCKCWAEWWQVCCSYRYVDFIICAQRLHKVNPFKEINNFLDFHQTEWFVSLLQH